VMYGEPEQAAEQRQTWQGYNSVYCGLLRDVHGNPVRPIPLAPAWRTPTVTGLATASYKERSPPAGTLDPDRLTVLGVGRCSQSLDKRRSS
jgi:hypothetical protein